MAGRNPLRVVYEDIVFRYRSLSARRGSHAFKIGNAAEVQCFAVAAQSIGHGTEQMGFSGTALAVYDKGRIRRFCSFGNAFPCRHKREIIFAVHQKCIKSVMIV
jgi:ATP-dependent DNA ligase